MADSGPITGNSPPVSPPCLAGRARADRLVVMTKADVPSGAILGFALLFAAAPASAQAGIDAYAGDWVGSSITVEAGSWPVIEAADFIVAIAGSAAEFEADWPGVVPDDGATAWEDLSQTFERAGRPGYYHPDDAADVFDGEPQFWAFAGEGGLMLGRMQIDEDSGRHLIFVCQLVPTEAGMDAVLVLTDSDAESARARVAMVRR